MSISASDVQKLRQATGVGMMDAKKALEEAKGDFEKAQEILRKKGAIKAEKRIGRETKQGIIDAYIHGNKIGVLIEVNSETDFVARNETFKTMVRDIAMHIAAASPLYLSRDEVPQEVIDKEMNFYREELKEQKKPQDMIEKIAIGKLEKYFAQIVLLEQPYIKDDSFTIKDLLNQAISTTGENMQIRRFCRYQLGE
jgi:elongation factor Ts